VVFLLTSLFISRFVKIPKSHGDKTRIQLFRNEKRIDRKIDEIGSIFSVISFIEIRLCIPEIDEKMPLNASF